MPEVGHYVVGLFDLMGQSTELEGLRRLPAGDNERAVYTEKVTAVLKKVREFRNVFGSLLESFTKPQTQGRPPFTPEQDARLKRWHGAPIQMMQFSDTVVTFVPIWKSDGELTMSGLAYMLRAAAGTIVLEHGNHVPIRGAIDIGAAIDFEPGEIYGPALAAAHGLESKLADWPRILVGQGAVDFISHCSSLSGAEPEHEMNRQMARLCSDLIMQDIDGLMALDYLSERFHQETWEILKGAQAFERGYSFAKGEHERFRNKRDSKLALRYDRLAQYYESRARIWQASQQ